MKQERNKPCSCGSGKKYKKCHFLIEFQEQREREEAALKIWRERLADPNSKINKSTLPFVMMAMAMAGMNK